MNVAMLTMLLSAGAIRVEPATVTFGPAEAALELVAPAAASVRVWCAACGDGAVSAAEPVGPGRFRARFTLPRERFPRVALLAVEVLTAAGQRTQEWVSLPVLANASLKLETKPGASVKVSIGAATFGPSTANAAGKLTLPVVVPPGYPSARVVASDRAGNLTTSAVDLAATPFARAAAALPPGDVSADQRVELEVFAVEADGAPLADGSRLVVSAKLGAAERPVPRSGGVFTVAYRAPKSLAGGPDTVTVSVEGAPSTQLGVPLHPAAPAHLTVALTPAGFTAGSGQRVAVVPSATDAFGNAVTGLEFTVTSDLGAVERGGGGVTLVVPDAFGGRRAARVRVAAPGVQGEGLLALTAGAPASAELVLPGNVAAGTALRGTVAVKDAWGNAVDATTVSVLSGDGRRATVTAVEGQGYAVGYETRAADPVGAFELAVRAGERKLARAEVELFPSQRDWAVAAGAFIGGSSNFKQARALSPRLALSVRLGGLPLEVGAEGSFAWYPRLSQTQTLDGLSTVDLEMSAWSAALTARYSRHLAIRWSLQLFAAAGAQHTESVLSAPGQTPVADDRWGPLARGGAGLGLHVLGGRVLLQLEYGLAPLGVGPVRGNALGAGLALGYLASF